LQWENKNKFNQVSNTGTSVERYSFSGGFFLNSAIFYITVSEGNCKFELHYF